MSEYYSPLSIDVTHRRDAWARDHGGFPRRLTSWCFRGAIPAIRASLAALRQLVGLPTRGADGSRLTLRHEGHKVHEERKEALVVFFVIFLVFVSFVPEP